MTVAGAGRRERCRLIRRWRWRERFGAQVVRCGSRRSDLRFMALVSTGAMYGGLCKEESAVTIRRANNLRREGIPIRVVLKLIWRRWIGRDMRNESLA